MATGSTFGGGGAFHTDAVGDHPSITAPNPSVVERFRDDPITANQTGIQEAGLAESTTDAADAVRDMRGGVNSR